MLINGRKSNVTRLLCVVSMICEDGSLPLVTDHAIISIIIMYNNYDNINNNLYNF